MLNEKQSENYYIFFKDRKEWIAIVTTITLPPRIVSKLGCSLITNHTQRGPNIVSSKKKRFTSAAVIYLGAKVTNTKGMATHMTHIRGTIVISLPSSFSWVENSKAINATISFPIIAEGTKLIFFADLIITAPTANPKAQTKPRKFPKRSPASKES